MNTRKSVYLAGPGVFHQDSDKIAAWLRDLCSEHDLRGCYPLDNLLAAERAGLSTEELAERIGLANEDLIRECDGIIADFSPFRGLAMDVGTAYEIGFARALGKPIAGYSNTLLPYLDRVKAKDPGCNRRPTDGELVDGAGWLIEDFGYVDNLMPCRQVPVFESPKAAIVHMARLLAG